MGGMPRGLRERGFRLATGRAAARIGGVFAARSPRNWPPFCRPDLSSNIPQSAVAWWKKAAATLAHGKLLTLDYGLTDQERLRPERSGGTLRTFARHHAGGGLLDNPGECDITAHVNFSAIEAAGRAAGLATEGLMEQGKFLTQILAQTQAEPGGFEAWTPSRTRQFQTLTHPDHLGRAFRVLIQSRQ